MEFMGRNQFSQALNVKTLIFGYFHPNAHNISDFYTIHPQEVAFADMMGTHSNRYQTYIEHEAASTPSKTRGTLGSSRPFGCA